MNVITVSELSRKIRSVIENDFKVISVVGEISNFRHHQSGHFYFTLKDDKSQIGANMWSSNNILLRFKPEDGMKVIVKGRVTVYESRGSYQIDVWEMERAGEGELQFAFEELKRKLFEEGLFDQVHKKELPEFPARVGLITSEAGAAYHDFVKITKKRYPFVKLFLISAMMQGASAPLSIINAIRIGNKSKYKPEMLVIARGGGSAEDLSCFNNEKLAREIFASEIPVVSAIGHEIDFTIVDFVSDLRAPTPSAAAEMIFPDKAELMKKLNSMNYELGNSVFTKFSNMKNQLNSISNNYYFKRPADILNQYRFTLDENEKLLQSIPARKLNGMKTILDSTEKLLNSLAPEQVLKRGFTIITRDNKVMSRKSMVKTDDNIEIKFFDGVSGARITKPHGTLTADENKIIKNEIKQK